MTRKKGQDKKSRLVEVTDRLIYHGSVHTTTLVDVAQTARVPLGNVYYYFKTKESLLNAVIARRSQEIKVLFAKWEKLPSLSDRLNKFIHYFSNQAKDLAYYGSPIGSLCQELAKQGGTAGALTAALMNERLRWVETQFQLAGKEQTAERLAEQLLSTLEGMSLLALTFKNIELVKRQSQQLSEWVFEQVGGATETPGVRVEERDVASAEAF